MYEPKIALIDKAPSRTNYKKHFEFDFDHYHLSSVAKDKILKADVDIDIDLDAYDYIILVGSEATKYYTKASVTNSAGLLLLDKFIPISNPAILLFKPEAEPDFQKSLSKLKDILAGNTRTIVGDFKGIDTVEETIEYLQEILNSDAETVAFDTEDTALYPRDGYVLGVSLSHKVQHGRYILADCFTDEALELLQKILDTRKIVFHNRKYDQKMSSYHLGLKIPSNADDTMVEHYVLDETMGTHGLKYLAIKFTDYGDYDKELDEFKKDYCKSHGMLEEDFTYDLIPFDIISTYAAKDAAVTLELHNKFRPLIRKNPKLDKLYTELLIPATEFLMNVEEVGIPFSKERLEASSVYLDKWIEGAKKEIYQFDEIKRFEADNNIIFNPNSVVQLRKVLFDYIGLKPTGKKTGTGAISTDAEVLEQLAEVHPFPKAVLKVRQLAKIRSSYVSKILPELDLDERIRTNFNLVFTTSGRLSSSGKFNAQQIPRDDPIIKGCIQAPPGYKIVSQDLKTAEVYYAAVLSGDKKLQEVFKQGGDFHSTIAKRVFNLPCEVEKVKELYPFERPAAKAVTFGINL